MDGYSSLPHAQPNTVSNSFTSVFSNAESKHFRYWRSVKPAHCLSLTDIQYQSDSKSSYFRPV